MPILICQKWVIKYWNGGIIIMTEEEKDELNEKIAKWCGFIKIESKYPFNWKIPEDDDNDETHKYVKQLPDFIGSFDACLKWMIPKIKSFEISYNSVTYAVSMSFSEDYAINESLSLAFCLAVEKLIDDEIKKND